MRSSDNLGDRAVNVMCPCSLQSSGPLHCQLEVGRGLDRDLQLEEPAGQHRLRSRGKRGRGPGLATKNIFLSIAFCEKSLICLQG